jgi:hypothetical protein
LSQLVQADALEAMPQTVRPFRLFVTVAMEKHQALPGIQIPSRVMEAPAAKPIGTTTDVAAQAARTQLWFRVEQVPDQAALLPLVVLADSRPQRQAVPLVRAAQVSATALLVLPQTTAAVVVVVAGAQLVEQVDLVAEEAAEICLLAAMAPQIPEVVVEEAAEVVHPVVPAVLVLR